MSKSNSGAVATLDFEQPIVEIERQIAALEARGEGEGVSDELATLYATRETILTKTYSIFLRGRQFESLVIQRVRRPWIMSI